MIRYLFPLAAPLRPFHFPPVSVHQLRWLLQYVAPLVLFNHVAAILKKTTMWGRIRPPPARPQASNTRQQAHSSILEPRAGPLMWSVMMTVTVTVTVGLRRHPLQNLHRMTMSL